MTFIATVPEDEATGAVAEMYDHVRETRGELTNFAQAWSARPEVYAAWEQLNGTIKAGMELRLYELATVAAARRLRSTYCALAHGTVLANEFLGAETVRAVVTDPDAAGLDPADAAVVDFAGKVVADAASITQDDVDRLRDAGLSDRDVLDVAVAAAARCFFSKTLDAVGVQADASFARVEPALREALTVGRPIAAA